MSAEYEKFLEEIERNLLDIKNKKQMATSDALIYVNKVGEKVNRAIGAQTGKGTVCSMYRKMEEICLMAAKIVPEDENYIIMQQADYWKNCAEQCKTHE